MNKELTVNDRATEFLLYSTSSSEVKVEVLLNNETLWLTQKRMATLFNVDRSVVTKHLKNIFNDKELDESSVCAKYAHTAEDGKNYQTQHYNLDAVISVGYRVNSSQATQFRIWATKQLTEYIIKGFVIDDERLKNPNNPFGTDYFDQLEEKIRDIRTSERRFYQKITDIYITSVDYHKNDNLTKDFFATVQNKMHFGIHGKTAAEVIANRADSKKPNMGITCVPEKSLKKSDIFIAWLVRKKWHIVFWVIIAVWLAKDPVSQLLYGDEIVHIKLSVGQDGYVLLDIPSKFIGPSHLSLSQQVKKIKEPVGMIPLAFTYPSFKPWPNKLLGESTDEEKVFLIITGGRGEKHGYNGLAYAWLQLKLEDNCKAEKYPEKKYNMHRYKTFMGCRTPNKRHFKDLYFYDAPRDSERDIIVKCSALSKTQKCRMYMKYDDMGLVSSNFSISHELLADWQNVIVDYQEFVSGFYENNISDMKKPTPLSEERKRNLSKRYKEEWKP